MLTASLSKTRTQRPRNESLLIKRGKLQNRLKLEVVGSSEKLVVVYTKIHSVTSYKSVILIPTAVEDLILERGTSVPKVHGLESLDRMKVAKPH